LHEGAGQSFAKQEAQEGDASDAPGGMGKHGTKRRRTSAGSAADAEHAMLLTNLNGSGSSSRESASGSHDHSKGRAKQGK